ncbi:phage repressor protein [Haloferax sp. Atlit-47N]|uniref:ArsR family transcriptional regulator n=2 Tax=Haloferacaceae TaxID=1644056 RepID=A0A847TUT8_HALVO|nr:winged helix-turn-helix domain-containing protein [Haloferax sp. AS1]NLV02194.1 ArsR family transcriptional regulator [Haloferax alexandrinus]RDZ40780.1 phage repressor protein [Haloferax sp. Atlit-47N]REA05130.1 phage repressor protein [Haloferax sp. Atlit-6N]MBC9986038.1 ArsR family transcriptional regulator [Haloferax sp. AS1]REA05134.1 phage repressor protein [Haloferax sp. Atlit-6N]
MRPRVSWMTGNDDTILEYFQEHDVALPPKGLEINLEREGFSVSYSTIHRRLKKLEQTGLVDRVRQREAYYAITDKGRAYLSGDLDASELTLDE